MPLVIPLALNRVLLLTYLDQPTSFPIIILIIIFIYPMSSVPYQIYQQLPQLLHFVDVFFLVASFILPAFSFLFFSFLFSFSVLWQPSLFFLYIQDKQIIVKIYCQSHQQSWKAHKHILHQILIITVHTLNHSHVQEGKA